MMEHWQCQFIRDLFSYSASRMHIERAFMIKHPHVPAKLYKYRQFTPNHIDALQKNVLWMSSPDRFNDPYDAAVYFDPDRFIVEDYSVEEFLALTKELDKTVKAGGEWRPQPIVKPIQAREWWQKLTAEIIGNADIPHKDKFLAIIKEISREQAAENVKRMSGFFRNNFSILSLSENNTSTLMWSHYSNSHKGFCIEYDFGKLPYGDLRRRLCFPVFYTRKLRDATRYMARTGQANFNNLFGQYMCLIKKDDWAYEKEWRIVHALGAPYANSEIAMPEPSAILLGASVSKDDEEMMRDFCGRQKIALKKMVQRPGSFDLAVTDILP